MLHDGGVMAQCGPMTLLISASIGNVPQPQTGVRAARESFTYLERIACLRDRFRQNYSEIPQDVDDPLGMEMIRNSMAIGDRDLTPMAAVAGTIADAVAEYLFERGMTKVVVDNGGDVAIRLRGDAPARIGIRPVIDQPGVQYVITLDPVLPSWGVATSGVGGRSFTRGTASAATVIATSASLADAAATAVANASFVRDKQVIQRSAEEMDPDTDISGLPVTVKLGPLSERKKNEALSGAIGRATELVRNRIIFGAFVAVAGKVAMTDFFRERIVV